MPVIVVHYKRRYWREAFWRQQLRTANLRYSDDAGAAGQP
jgi:hypothetical protein